MRCMEGVCDPATAIFVLVKWYIAYSIVCTILRDISKSRKRGRKAGTAQGTARGMDASLPSVTTKIDQVIGLESVKEDLRQFTDYATHPDKYTAWGVKLPKGVLLAGPPGTGKTLLVRAIASEMGLPVESACGSEFVEMYVGVGASRVRELFDRAKQHERCIVFIDEIDAVGGKRGHDMNSERDTTLNQILVEMDGFSAGTGIIVFAATNLVSRLDPALTRSGRFDRKVYFDPPNAKERQQMWNLFMGEVSLPRGMSTEILAHRSAGLTGADIANICNLAKLRAVGRGAKRHKLCTEDVREAMDEVVVGREKKERTLSEAERDRVAHHEAGHALLAHMLQDCEPPLKVSIVPRGEAALGFSQQAPDDSRLYTCGAILARVIVLLGGRAAEKLMYGDTSTGAADDIERASVLVHRCVHEWGMDPSTGPANAEAAVGGLLKEGFTRCAEILDTLDKKAFEMVSAHAAEIKDLAAHLLRTDTLEKQDLVGILPGSLKNKFQTQVDILG